ncbi:hypothetical protein [Erythrobacter alti]|uniref:hypothetical protein n=1 Tax=Erythrobacter alti TaxID=1896145 RepID=UPI0030F3A611
MTDSVQRRGGRWNGWRIAGWGSAAALLLLPVLAGQVTDEVNWTLGDFSVFAIMLATLGLALEAIAHIRTSRMSRTILMIGAAIVFLLVWAELAVGLVD